MANVELAALPDATGRSATTPQESQIQADTPLFVLTLKDIQMAAQDRLGRHLTEPELPAVMRDFSQYFDWVLTLRAVIDACQLHGKVGPAVKGTSPSAPNHLDQALTATHSTVESPDAGHSHEYVVFYSLSSLMLVRAADKEEADLIVFDALHSTVGSMARHGLTANEAREVGLHDALVEIDQIDISPESP